MLESVSNIMTVDNKKVCETSQIYANHLQCLYCKVLAAVFIFCLQQTDLDTAWIYVELFNGKKTHP